MAIQQRTCLRGKLTLSLNPAYRNTNLMFRGFGPGIDGLFFQSNLGVVTKMGIHLMHAPKHLIECSVSVPNEDDLAVLVGKLSRLERHHHIDNHISVASLWRQCTVSGQPDVYARITFSGEGVTDPKVLSEIQKEKGWGFWKAYFAVYGPEEVCEVNWKIIKKEFDDVPGAQFTALHHEGKNQQPLVVADVPEPEIPFTGMPTLTSLPVMDIRGKFGGHIDFSPVFPSGGTELQEWYKGAVKRFDEAGVDFWSDFHVWGRYTIAIIVMIFGPHEKERTEALFRTLLDDAEKINVTEYRTHIDYMDEVAGLFNFNNGSLGKFVQGLKDQLDPKGILAPGKSGIWNSNIRAQKLLVNGKL